jgi:hypothetical protein
MKFRTTALMGIEWLVAAMSLPPLPALAQGSAASGLRVDLFIDQRRNESAMKTIGNEATYPVYVYRQTRNADGSMRLQPADDKLMSLWKGDAPLTPKSEGMWESQDQFTPVLLILQVSNDGTTPVEIGRSYLRVRESLTDRQPFVRMADPDQCGGMQSIIELWNDGWRTAEKAVLTYRFGSGNSQTAEFSTELGQLGHVAFDPWRAMASLMPVLPELRQRPPKCQSINRVPACLAALEREGKLGRLAGVLHASPDADVAAVPVTAVLSYQWTHHPSGELRTHQQRLETTLRAFKFDTGSGPECGAAGPGEGGFRSILLQTDTSNYQVPLPYRGPVGVRGSRRFELTLKAERASSHQFEVVVETTDGRSAVSPPVDLLYFVPTKNRSPMREIN